jgi:hypothetical protein
MLRRLTLLLLLACAARGADEDEARFKPRAYAPSKTLSDGAYQAAAYRPARAERGIGEPLKKPRGGLWNLFSPKPLESAPALEEAPSAPKTPYAQTRHVSAPSMTPDPGGAAAELGDQVAATAHPGIPPREEVQMIEVQQREVGRQRRQAPLLVVDVRKTRPHVVLG